ncbi:MAG: hypothetical protein ABJA78_16620 [Ferruginibacter sp.]
MKKIMKIWVIVLNLRSKLYVPIAQHVIFSIQTQIQNASDKNKLLQISIGKNAVVGNIIGHR